MIAKFKYRCRMCGQIYNSASTAEKIAMPILVNAMHDVGLPAVGKIHLIDAHSHADGSVGVSDLMGYELTNE